MFALISEIKSLKGNSCSPIGLLVCRSELGQSLTTRAAKPSFSFQIKSLAHSESIVSRIEKNDTLFS